MLENLYSLQSTWMWVGTAKAEPHCCVYQLLFQAQITLLLLYSTTHLFNKKKKGGKKLWFIFPLHRNCNISLWLFPPLSEEISAIKIAISALKCCIKPFEALLFLFILHIAGRIPGKAAVRSDEHAPKQLLRMEKETVKSIRTGKGSDRQYYAVSGIPREVPIPRLSVAQCQDTFGYRPRAFPSVCP